MVQNGRFVGQHGKFITNVANELRHWESIGEMKRIDKAHHFLFEDVPCHINRLNGHNDDLWTLNFQTKVQLLTIKCLFTVSFQPGRITSARILSSSSSSQVCFLWVTRKYLHFVPIYMTTVWESPLVLGFDLTRYYLALQWCSRDHGHYLGYLIIVRRQCLHCKQQCIRFLRILFVVVFFGWNDVKFRLGSQYFIHIHINIDIIWIINIFTFADEYFHSDWQNLTIRRNGKNDMNSKQKENFVRL